MENFRELHRNCVSLRVCALRHLLSLMIFEQKRIGKYRFAIFYMFEKYRTKEEEQ